MNYSRIEKLLTFVLLIYLGCPKAEIIPIEPEQVMLFREDSQQRFAPFFQNDTMMKKGFLLVLSLLIFNVIQAQENDTIQLSEVTVTAKAPVTKERLNQALIKERNLAQDVPLLLQQTPSAVATSDAGNGTGYTGIRIRGTDASRILVSIDGVPINDAESQAVFWVNMPDVASSAGGITVQRGVGSSANGTSNFGGSILIDSDGFSNNANLELQSVGGSFGTYKNTLIAESGNWAKDKLNLRLRFSQLNSEGYIDRASSELWAYQLEGKYQFSESSNLKFNYLGGQEKTYQAWYGIDAYTMENDRTFNYAGAIYSEDYSEILGFYDNQTDNYKQDHFFTHWTQKWSPHFISRWTGYYTYGRGYYEELAQFQNPEDYEIENAEISDLVRRKWLQNHLYGSNLSFNFRKDAWKLEGNWALSQYQGNHFGEVIDSEFLPLSHTVEYYRNTSTKTDFSSYLKASYRLNRWELYADAQIRSVHYKAKTPESGRTDIDDNPDFNKNFNFFNPKLGFNINLDNGKLYALWAVSHREPTRTDILNNATVEAEQLMDWELGYQVAQTKWSFNTNLYFMSYDNQLVLSGRLDDVGNPIRENVGKSYRMGWENQWKFSLSQKFNFFGNFSFSINRNKDYTIETEEGLQNLGDTPIAFSPDLIASLGLEMKPIKNVNIQVLNKYVGEQYLNNTKNQNLSLSSYFLTDVFVQFTPKLSFLNKFALTGQFNTIFNQEYESNGYVYDGLPYYYPQAGFNFLLGVRFDISQK